MKANEMMKMDIIHEETNEYEYVCSMSTGEIIASRKLPVILKRLREYTGYNYKVPHGNKVRTIILEHGVCRITDGNDIYEITIKRW